VPAQSSEEKNDRHPEQPGRKKTEPAGEHREKKYNQRGYKPNYDVSDAHVGYESSISQG
jgi:hypothetical protein